MSPPIGHEEHIAHLRAVTARVGAIIDPERLELPVPSCPGWTVRDLVWHLGSIHVWATTAIREARNDGSDPGRPTDDALQGWYIEQADRLVAAVEQTPVDAEVWAFCQPPWSVTFWSRRQAHESTIHLWDLQSAVGGLNLRIDTHFAADGLDEVLTMFYPRQVRLRRIPPLDRSLGLIASGDEGQWILGPGRGAPEASVIGPAPALYLLVWGRIDLEHPDLTIQGDEAVARAVLDAQITP